MSGPPSTTRDGHLANVVIKKVTAYCGSLASVLAASLPDQSEPVIETLRRREDTTHKRVSVVLSSVGDVPVLGRSAFSLHPSDANPPHNAEDHTLRDITSEAVLPSQYKPPQDFPSTVDEDGPTTKSTAQLALDNLTPISTPSCTC
ncbi:hypothetical protein KCU67_g1128, partial [Aureobasidium melanogenum]